MSINYKKILTLFTLGVVSFSAYAQVSDSRQYNVNPLELYSNVTSLTMAFNEKYGKQYRLPVNTKGSINVILKNSNTQKYMGNETYNGYSANSEFSKEANNMMNALAKLIGSFKSIGFIQEIKTQGKTPALMFDIDNTIELTSFDDDYWTKSGVNDPATATFIKKVCFQDGIDCYFITARTCNHDEAIATKKWLQQHLNLSNKQVSKYVFLSGSIPDNACTTNPSEKVAYKDILRQDLSKTRNVYWLMSIGDQMTDWFGKHSGLKVWYPNEMFDTSIVGNNHNHPSQKGALKTVVAPTEHCYQKLKQKALVDSTIQYCQRFKKDHFISSSD
jgi:hypothetical protein